MKDKPAVDSRIYSLDGIRAIAALLVFFLHVQYFSTIWNDPILPDSSIAKIFFNLGHFAVDAFFIMSAYLMTTIWLKKPNYHQFIKARFLRIAPAYYLSVTVVVLVVLSFGALDVPSLLKEWLMHIAFLGGTIRTPGFTVNPVYWSLSVEMALYMTIPIWVVIARDFGVRGLIIFALVVSLSWRYWAPTLDMSPWLAHAFPGQLFEISLGVAMSMQKISFPSRAAVPALAILIYIAWLGPTNQSPVIYMAVALLMLVIVIVAIESSRFDLFSRSPVVTWMADVSYSFYLWHAAVLYGLTLVIKDPILLTVISLITSLLVAWVSRRFIERMFHT